MNRAWYKPLVALMWLVLPITALEYRSAWSELPARMAVHFDADWKPNGYSSREGALMLGLGIMAVLLVIFTVGSLASHALKPSAAWILLVAFYMVLGFLWYGNHSIIQFNLNAKRSSQSSVLSSPPGPRGHLELSTGY